VLQVLAVNGKPVGDFVTLTK